MAHNHHNLLQCTRFAGSLYYVTEICYYLVVQEGEAVFHRILFY